MKDRRGTTIEAGQKVAYNQSGTVAYGEITDIKEGKRGTTFHIHNLEGVDRPYMPAKSKVTNSYNLLVLTEEMI